MPKNIDIGPGDHEPSVEPSFSHYQNTPPSQKHVSRQREQLKNKLNRLAWLMDNSFRIPGTQLRFGIDGLIGLFPGLGDALGALISSHIISQAAQMGVPKSILLKMAFNVAIDALLGIFPVIGDMSDFIWKANYRNVKLLNDYVEEPQKTKTYSRFFVGIIGLLVIGVVVLIGAFGFLLMRWLWYSVQGN
ncbi:MULTISPECIES: DUF4112 domain-containing protein [Nitrosomonas]|uniref:Uncharacterized protein DUF4112 n=1 Tax=Nitrosomonas communis TaxID=44574 RepID=A0A5D3Y733_9PROT|nr:MULTISPECIES: DUF4112 domain-containing protein [Nitrosomonas]TYP73722.1 uncharacterized protein DUF4112 [Nitrosomonas communis]UVS62435.1 DUF4112 domain-containing protein [Nitrosomonas sp. PLL12]